MFPYQGGKNRHIKYLDPIFPPLSQTFVDVFGGAGWVSLLSKTTQCAYPRVYNDYNPHMANIWHQFITNPNELLQLLKQYPFENEQLYRQFQQDIFAQPFNPQTTEHAAKYLYLLVQSYSGQTINLTSSVYFNKKWSKLIALTKKLQDPKYLNLLNKVNKVENLDCIDVIHKYDSPTTFFYVDPPYYNLEHYYVQDFPNHKHQELADTLKNIQGQFALSYYEFPLLHQWYPQSQYHWHTYNIYNPSGNQGKLGAKKKQEIVITNY